MENTISRDSLASCFPPAKPDRLCYQSVLLYYIIQLYGAQLGLGHSAEAHFFVLTL
jgi:hypothetical protein